MSDTQLRWSWLPAVNEDKEGRPINCYCWVCKSPIADGEPRAMNNLDRKPACAECAIKRGCPPEDQVQKKGTARKPAAPNLIANESGESITLLREIRDLLKQLVNSGGLVPQASKDFSPPKNQDSDLDVFKENPEPSKPVRRGVLEAFLRIARDIGDPELKSMAISNCFTDTWSDELCELSIKASFKDKMMKFIPEIEKRLKPGQRLEISTH